MRCLGRESNTLSPQYRANALRVTQQSQVLKVIHTDTRFIVIVKATTKSTNSFFKKGPSLGRQTTKGQINRQTEFSSPG